MCWPSSSWTLSEYKPARLEPSCKSEKMAASGGLSTAGPLAARCGVAYRGEIRTGVQQPDTSCSFARTATHLPWPPVRTRTQDVPYRLNRRQENLQR